MPKKKTGAKKKADKQKTRQKELRSGATNIDLGKHPSNITIECEQCKKKQKNRAFCYFCQTLNRTAICGHCGKMKCMSKTGDCIVKHGATFATGLGMVGAICDHCESFICHGRKCISVHGCTCPLQNADCIECKRGVWDHGGRIFKCSFCGSFICEDDQFEHQASCQKLESEDYKCLTCNRIGQLACLICKASYCDEHVKRKGQKLEKGQFPPCPKCGNPTKEIYKLSLSTRRYEYGRQDGPDYDFDEGGYNRPWENDHTASNTDYYNENNGSDYSDSNDGSDTESGEDEDVDDDNNNQKVSDNISQIDDILVPAKN